MLPKIAQRDVMKALIQVMKSHWCYPASYKDQ